MTYLILCALIVFLSLKLCFKNKTSTITVSGIVTKKEEKTFSVLPPYFSINGKLWDSNRIYRTVSLKLDFPPFPTAEVVSPMGYLLTDEQMPISVVLKVTQDKNRVLYSVSKIITPTQIKISID